MSFRTEVGLLGEEKTSIFLWNKDMGFSSIAQVNPNKSIQSYVVAEDQMQMTTDKSTFQNIFLVGGQGREGQGCWANGWFFAPCNFHSIPERLREGSEEALFEKANSDSNLSNHEKNQGL